MKERTCVNLSEFIGIQVQAAMMKDSGFHMGEEVELRPMADTVVLMRAKMNAAELIRTANSLRELAAELYGCFGNACGRCHHCSEECPYEPEDYGVEVDLPEELRYAANIPLDAKLRMEFTNGTVVIHVDEDKTGLRTVPLEILENYLAHGCCPCDMEFHFLKGDVIYGGE